MDQATEFKWTSGVFSYLGIDISVNHSPTLIKEKYDSITRSLRIRQYIETYGTNSEMDKILIQKQLLLSRLVYHVAVMPSPCKDQYRTLDKICLDLLWSGRHKMSKERLLQPYENGGLNAHSAEFRNDSLNLAWITRLLNTENVSRADEVKDKFTIPFNELFTYNISMTGF